MIIEGRYIIRTPQKDVLDDRLIGINALVKYFPVNSWLSLKSLKDKRWRGVGKCKQDTSRGSVPFINSLKYLHIRVLFVWL